MVHIERTVSPASTVVVDVFVPLVKSWGQNACWCDLFKWRDLRDLIANNAGCPHLHLFYRTRYYAVTSRTCVRIHIFKIRKRSYVCCACQYHTCEMRRKNKIEFKVDRLRGFVMNCTQNIEIDDTRKTQDTATFKAQIHTRARMSSQTHWRRHYSFLFLFVKCMWAHNQRNPRISISKEYIAIVI